MTHFHTSRLRAPLALIVALALSGCAGSGGLFGGGAGGGTEIGRAHV